HHAVDAVLGKALVDQGAGTFGRVAVSPGRPAEPVAQVDGSVASARPEVKPAQELSRADIVSGPGAKPRMLVVKSQVERDNFVPDLVAAGPGQPAGDEAHHLGVAVEADQVVLVRSGKPADSKARSLQVNMHRTIVRP